MSLGVLCWLGRPHLPSLREFATGRTVDCILRPAAAATASLARQLISWIAVLCIRPRPAAPSLSLSRPGLQATAAPFRSCYSVAALPCLHNCGRSARYGTRLRSRPGGRCISLARPWGMLARFLYQLSAGAWSGMRDLFRDFFRGYYACARGLASRGRCCGAGHTRPGRFRLLVRPAHYWQEGMIGLQIPEQRRRRSRRGRKERAEAVARSDGPRGTQRARREDERDVVS